MRKLILAAAFLLLLSAQGCMFMHFMEDHHGGMMGHGMKKEDHGGSGKETRDTAPERAPDQGSRQHPHGN